MEKRLLDQSTLCGVILSLFGVVTGLWLEGGSIAQIAQPTAALIVLFGTMGAVLMQYPFSSVRAAMVRLREVFSYASPDVQQATENLVNLCSQVRRNGWVYLDPQLDQIPDPFLRKAMTLAVDGVSRQSLRDALEMELDLTIERDEEAAGVLFAAGGFAPTLGIIGAVLGLIQVMQRIDDLSEIGRGIAVAFVSTLYGLAAANLAFLPWGGKVKIRARQKQQHMEMTIEAVLLMMDGVSARALRERLEPFSGHALLSPSEPQAPLESHI
jgi:chemotaxis protein MotA